MLNRIKSLFEASGTPGATNLSKNSEIQLAAAALLVESASIDGLFDQIERRRISSLLEAHFKLTVAETETLIKSPTPPRVSPDIPLQKRILYNRQ